VTNPDYTAIAIVLDRSGSMARIRSDAEGGLNSFLDGQKKLSGQATLTLVQFDDQFDCLERMSPLSTVEPIQLVPRGMTALLDAIGRTISLLGEDLAKLPEDERPGKVLFAIITDGWENASKEWTRDQVKQLVEQQREDYKWEFVFLAANQDAALVGPSMGVPRTNTFTYAHTGSGVRGMSASLGTYTSSYRGTGTGSWVKEEDDHDDSED